MDTYTVSAPATCDGNNYENGNPHVIVPGQTYYNDITGKFKMDITVNWNGGSNTGATDYGKQLEVDLAAGTYPTQSDINAAIIAHVDGIHGSAVTAVTA